MNTPFDRRAFLSQSTASAAALAAGWTGLAATPARSASGPRAPRILLRPATSQKGNIGDIAHTPGALRLFETHFPEAEFTVWPVGISEESRAGLLDMFPGVRLVEGELDRDGTPSTPELAEAWADADLLLHGSGPGFKGQDYMQAWRAASDKPYGIFGITSDPVYGIHRDHPEGATLEEFRRLIEGLPADHLSAQVRTVLDGAAFIFCRDTLTQRHFHHQKIQSPVIEFGPDATFALQIRDDERADATLAELGLERDKFLCAIPRLRYTPYHRIHGTPAGEKGRAKDAINEKTREKDHAKLRDLIVRWVRNTGLKVLACPEMSYQVELARELLIDPLPDDVKAKVVWLDRFWQPDETASVYARALAVASFECHSPIIALTNGTPAFYLRQPTDTIKGQMYHDIGVSDWTFEVDESSGEQWFARLKEIHDDPSAARRRVEQAMAKVASAHRKMVEAARDVLGEKA